MTFATGLKGLASRPRLMTSAAAAVAIWLAWPAEPSSTRLLVAWDGGIVIYLVLVLAMMAGCDHEAIQRRADREDAGAATVLVLTIAGAVASLIAIGAEIQGIHAGKGASSPLHVGLAGGTILLSWLFVHTAFSVHYAHDYYAGVIDRRGLRFPGEDPPDYWDFLYFSFNLGAAAQTSDVQVESSRMRRLVLAHTILSFLFNTTILALAINVGAGLL